MRLFNNGNQRESGVLESLFENEMDKGRDDRRADYKIPLLRLKQLAAALGVEPRTNHDVTASDVISWRCSEAHEFLASWRDQQRRRCPKCPALSYGEKLARSLLNIYFPNGNWRKIREKGLDPNNRDLRLEIDLLSDAYEIFVECQSSLHVADGHKQGLATRTPINEIIRRDRVKRNLPFTHPRFENYRHVELWLELSEVRKIVTKAIDANIDPVEAIIDRFSQSLADGGVIFPDRPVPGLDELFSGFSDAQRAAEVLESRGLFLQAKPWLGVSFLAVRCGKCSHEWTSSLTQLRRGWSRDRSGCAMCWGAAFGELRSTRSDEGWAAFRELCKEYGFLLVEPTSGRNNLPVKVREEATGQIFEGRRDRIAQRLLDGLPIIDARRIEYEKRGKRVAVTIARHRATLGTYGIVLTGGQDRPMTARDPAGEIRTNRFEIRYLGCPHKATVPLGPFLTKLKKHKSRKNDGIPGLCPRCRREKIAQEKTNWMTALAEEYGVSFLGPYYVDATKTRYKFSCLPGCTEAQPYKALISNLEKNGVACRGCNRIRRAKHKSASKRS